MTAKIPDDAQISSAMCGWCMSGDHENCRSAVQRSHTVVKRKVRTEEMLNWWLVCNCDHKPKKKTTGRRKKK